MIQKETTFKDVTGAGSTGTLKFDNVEIQLRHNKEQIFRLMVEQ